MKPVPILIFSDNPAISTGLARITRHLAIILSSMPEFRVGTFGRGGISSRKLPFTQYVYPENAEWGQGYLPMVWNNFAGDEPGIIFTIMDAVRMHWFAQPKYITQPGPVKELLESGKFKRWGYFPIDHECCNGMLSEVGMDAIMGYDRHLGYTMFGAEILSRITSKAVTWIPHGINFEIFRPKGREGVKYGMKIPTGTLVVGMVGTNQIRKDWGMACSIIAELKKRDIKVCFWACIDDLNRFWDIPSLLKDYGIENESMIMSGSQMADDELSFYYSMCDVTILPTMGEGFGYPIVESMACGTPCVTINYAGGAELVSQKSWLVEPIAFRIEAPLNAYRPVSDTKDWCNAIERVMEEHPSVDECRASVEHLDWTQLGPVWKRYFLEGIQA